MEVSGRLDACGMRRLPAPLASTFFFYSRRRYTRYWRDWSSDVCSSDLSSSTRRRCRRRGFRGARAHHDRDLRNPLRRHLRLVEEDPAEVVAVRKDLVLQRQEGTPRRSEERRVGKECRPRAASEQCKEKA